MEKVAQKFTSFDEAQKADADFYGQLSGEERLQLLLELLDHDPDQRLERVSRITELQRR